jgi:NAD(P)-dependent dehydrogenase (short-subunit alcohol dehydrogenase family)
MSFENRTILITGAAGHLGRTVAATFAQAGASLLLLDRDAEALAAAFQATSRCALHAVDLLDARQTQFTVHAGLARFARVDVVCHLAGGFRMGEAVHETSDSTWDFVFDVNARSFVNLARAVVPHLIERGGGRIVSVGAFAAQKGVAQMGAYCAAKSSVIRLTEAMSAELRHKHINVNCVLPTIIDTADNRAAMPDADSSRWVSPQALADVIAFLASDAARAVHGAALPVTGLSA